MFNTLGHPVAICCKMLDGATGLPNVYNAVAIHCVKMLGAFGWALTNEKKAT